MVTVHCQIASWAPWNECRWCWTMGNKSVQYSNCLFHRFFHHCIIAIMKECQLKVYTLYILTSIFDRTTTLYLQISATDLQPFLGACSLVFSGQLADEEH